MNGTSAILTFLDIFFIIFHSTLSLFNITGWIWPRTRRLHLVTISLTAFSWFILGILYGWGYCFCTDWHWQVREAMGRPVNSYSYIHFLVLEFTGKDLPVEDVDMAVLVLFLVSLATSVTLNIRDQIRKKKAVGRGY